ncbi:RRM domain-containing protein [Aphelenchoides besseyi]|nr:RRM domain-containing protein [Aphelenchoides besseyi]KAI6209497.1 RRM domain-containing protein [Aphelenchoides besseyi]
MALFSHKFSSVEKSQRSVFVGNISYDVSEDQIRQVFSTVGTVVHFRLVHDRDTGRPKGFGFCEFSDAEAAEKAIRNFNGRELNGRPLRVDSAASSERNLEEAQQLQTVGQAARDPASHSVEDALYGKEPEPGKAPEAIAKTVSTLPPEQMFEVMKQMKRSVTTDPIHTRNLLMENPQLAYALLQAQVVMRVVDPKVAYSMLHRETPAVQHPFHQQPSNMFANGSSASSIQNRQQTSVPPPAVQSNYSAPPPRFNGPSHLPPNAMPPPSMPQTASAPTNSSAEEEANQAQMLMRVIQLTDEQVALLPVEDRAKVLELRNKLRVKVAANQQ